MKCWGKYIVLSMTGVLVAIGGSHHQAVAAKPINPINKAYNQITTAPLLRPSRVKLNTHMTFDIVLKPKNEQGLFKRAMAVNTPGNAQFKDYLTPSGIRAAYGQSTRVTHQWQVYLKRHHLKTFVYDNGLLLRVSGKVRYIDKTFKTNVSKATYHANPLQFSKAKPTIPKDLAKTVWTVLGMGAHNRKYVFPDADVQMMTHHLNMPKQINTPKQFADLYHTEPLYKEGLTGKGQTIGIIAFGTLVKSNAFKFWQHQGAGTNHDRLKVESVPGSTFKKGYISRDEAETTMDVEYAGALAPKANVKVYWEQNPLATPMDTINAYSNAFNENQVSSLSNSWGIGPSSISKMLVNRKVQSPDYRQALNLVLAQGALQGISCFTAAGDTGALINSLRGISGNHALLDRTISDSDPLSANPWITSCGGTIPPATRTIHQKGLNFKASIKKERSWGPDYAWEYLQKHAHNMKMILAITHGLDGSGGGFSHLTATPTYQLGVPGVNTFNARQYFSNLAQPIFNPPLIHGKDSGRNYPDVAADAGGLKGYLIYQKEKKYSPWTGGGGTSIVGPQFAGMTALINSQSGRPRMGFWNAQIYQLAQQPDSPFHPLNDTTNNSNMYYTGQPGTVYNQASGLGTIDFAKLAKVYK
ncbi:protease pro-enzyme activation domain-containing protein [Lentilactobacillus raoultii]|uniref:Protease pro-enzyme activation domain-containing protein n=1 Tax=Lentilactobacillus raoultii TaxID=1987503 RepID=A0ABW3PVQ9_9LACO|nr:S53 family serine peptidase [Lentilactobacillus raoultii]